MQAVGALPRAGQVMADAIGESLESIVAAFATGGEDRTHIRSKSATIRLDRRTLHLKTSDIDLAAEAAALAVAAALPDGRGIRAVRLVAFDAARNVLVTEHVEDGGSLFNDLWNFTSPWGGRRHEAAHVLDLAARATDWLKAFHALSVSSTSSASSTGPSRDDARRCLQSVVARTFGKLSVLEGTGAHGLADDELAEIRRFVDRAAGDSAWLSLPVARLHGDFHPANMLVTRADAGDRPFIHVLDFGDSTNGFPLEDFARFWCAIWEIARTGVGRQAVLDPLLDRLQTAWCLDRRAIEAPPFQLMRTLNAVTRMLEAATVARRLPLRTRRMVARFARVHGAWLLETARQGSHAA